MSKSHVGNPEKFRRASSPDQRKLALAILAMALLPSLAYSQTDLGLEVGLGGLTGGRDSRDPLLLGAHSSSKVRGPGSFALDVRFEGELSHWKYPYTYSLSVPGRSDPWGLRLVIDILPELSLNVNKAIMVTVGAGFTLGMRKKENTWSDFTSSIFGASVRSSLTYENQPFFDRFTVKYRYLAENPRYEGILLMESFVPYPDKYEHQSVDVAFSTGIRWGQFSFEGGVQIENWISKGNYYYGWSDWSADREFILFAGVGTAL